MNNLSEEEKKAIEYCKYTIDLANRLDEVIINLRKEPVIKILNLIQKQQKEIEKLKENYIRLQNTEAIQDIYIKKDKIKAKIEEVDDKEMTVNLVNRSAGKTFQQAVNYEVIKVLQELLEE